MSISTLFMAGYIPGILMGVGSMVVAFIYAKKHKYPVSGRTPMKEAVKVTLEAIPSLLLIIIVIGGIVGASSLPLRDRYLRALLPDSFHLLQEPYREVLHEDSCKQRMHQRHHPVPDIRFLRHVLCHGILRNPGSISEGIMSISTNKYVILLLMNIILMVVGMFMDITPAILIFTPIFLPIAQSLGMTDIQFGVMLIFNMCLGNITLLLVPYCSWAAASAKSALNR